MKQVLGDEAHFLVNAMFRIFDDDNSGTIDFEEFILALNATKSGVTIISDDLYLRYSQDDNSGPKTAMDIQCVRQVPSLPKCGFRCLLCIYLGMEEAQLMPKRFTRW